MMVTITHCYSLAMGTRIILHSSSIRKILKFEVQLLGIMWVHQGIQQVIGEVCI